MDLAARSIGIFALSGTMLVGVVVGIRLLLLARRTRCFPELSIGLGLALIAVVGLPLAVLGRIPVLLRTPIGDLLFGAGLCLACVGIVLLWAFTWNVFRRTAAWARGLVFAVALVLAVSAGGLLQASARATTLPEILPLTRPWAVAIVLTVSGAFTWTGLESFAYYRRVRRRLALGLSDPVVVNRFLLWAVTGFAIGLLATVIAVLLLQGRAILVDPIALSVISGASVFGGTAWLLTFLPPAFYLDFVRARASGCSEPSAFATPERSRS
jgi:hypothetical protein